MFFAASCSFGGGSMVASEVLLEISWFFCLLQVVALVRLRSGGGLGVDGAVCRWVALWLGISMSDMKIIKV